MKKYIFIQLNIFLLFTALLAHTDAQLLPKTVSLNASPLSPSPGQKVEISAATPFFDKNTAYFDWTIDGVPKDDLSGPGKNKIMLTAGPLGSIVRVSVAVSRAGGAGGISEISLPVSDLSLTWFADTRVPTWYKGKALSVSNAEVEIAAFPEFVLEGARLSASGLIYRWSLDNEKNALTGVGERTFRIRASPSPNVTHQVAVVVEDVNKRIRKEGRIFIPSESPRVRIYPFSPLGGIEFRNGTGVFSTLRRGLVDFIAEPFFFVIQEKGFRYSWSVERNAVTTAPPRPNLLTLSTQEGPPRAIPISVSVSSDNAFMSSVFETLNVILR